MFSLHYDLLVILIVFSLLSPSLPLFSSPPLSLPLPFFACHLDPQMKLVGTVIFIFTFVLLM